MKAGIEKATIVKNIIWRAWCPFSQMQQSVRKPLTVLVRHLAGPNLFRT